MSEILRSILPDPARGDNADMMFHNYCALRESVLRFDLPTEVNIYEYIKDFALKHGHLPEMTGVIDHFEQAQQFDEADRIQQISNKNIYYRGDFMALVERTVEESRMVQLASAMADAKVIAKTGLEMKEGRTKKLLKGSRDAGNFLVNEVAKINTPTFGSRIGGEALTDGEDFWEEYERAKDSKLDILPVTGLEMIDTALGGFRKKELYILAAFTGHLKSTSAMNWVYNQAVYGGTNTLYFSLEMHYSQCRRIIYTYHSMHPKFRAKRMALGIQPSQSPDVGIEPHKIKNGLLNTDEVAFLQDVIKDLDDGVKAGKYGSIRFEVADPNTLDFTVENLRSRAEVLAQAEPIKMIVVDHALLVSPRKWVASTTDRLNEVIRDLKKTALGFNRGEGVPILCLFQISREGYKAAEKNGGSYNLTHLSYANEAERSADVVISNWYGDDQRENSQVKYQCLKSRDQAPFQDFEAQLVWPYGRILNMPLQFKPVTKKAGGNKTNDNPLDDVL
jgi:hypothetical protein